MNLSKLSPATGSVKAKKTKIGRGEGTGKGGTSTKGHKGAKSRSGYSKKIGFEGGQMPLQRRVPKFGFTNINRKEYRTINLDTIQELFSVGKISEIVDLNVLISLGFLKKKESLKILGRGELTSKLEVKAHKFTASAKKSILEVGGKIEIIK